MYNDDYDGGDESDSGMDIKVYTSEIEDYFIQFFITDSDLFVRCMNIINDEHYNDPDNKKIVFFLKDYANKHSDLPSLKQIAVVTGCKLEKLDDCGDKEKDWFLSEYEQFARHKEIELAIDKSPDLLDEYRYGEVETLIRNAVSTSLVKDLGMDYFGDPLGRLEEVANTRGAISTGFKALDEKLYGGVNRGEISIFAGQSGSGKSVFLQNVAVNWANAGLNVLYVTLELSEQLCAMRLDAMLTGYTTRQVLKNRQDVDAKLKVIQETSGGNLRLVQLKNGCTANDVKAFVKEYEIQTGTRIDGILLDYLDLFMPTNAKISPENLFIKDKYVTENLRDLAVELDCLMMTASQLNRGSHDENVFSHANIAGGLSKINTADNVFGIYVTNAMKEAGRYELQMMKTRSSSGVGSSVDLAFDKDCLRVRDLMPHEIGSTESASNAIIASLKVGGSGGGIAPSAMPPAIDEEATEEENNKQSMSDLADVLGKINRPT